MQTLMTKFVRDDEGQDLIEYAILIGLITVGTVAIVKYIGTWTKGQFTGLSTELGTAS
jgi:Flp pilus assembly pilin Flp